MVELRKRPAPPAAQPPPPAKRSSSASKVKKVADKVKAAVAGEKDEPVKTDAGVASDGVTDATTAAPENGEASGGKKLGASSVGSKVELQGFGGKVSTHDGKEVDLAELVKGSEKGVVVFTYPKASTPGCTTQACIFRDSYDHITSAGYKVYGLSTDSAKSNTTFVTKNSLPYPLLCDPNATLTSAIGMKKPGPGKSTTRGVVIIDEEGTVKLWEQAGPQKTLDAVLDFLKSKGTSDADIASAASGVVQAPPQHPDTKLGDTKKAADPLGRLKFDEFPLIRTPTNEEAEAAETAAEVGESAAKIDSMEEVRT